MVRTFANASSKTKHDLPTAKLTKTFKDPVLMSGGTKYKSKLGNIEMYAVANSELVMAFPGNKNANAVAWKDMLRITREKEVRAMDRQR